MGEKKKSDVSEVKQDEDGDLYVIVFSRKLSELVSIIEVLVLAYLFKRETENSFWYIFAADTVNFAFDVYRAYKINQDMGSGKQSFTEYPFLYLPVITMSLLFLFSLCNPRKWT